MDMLCNNGMVPQHVLSKDCAAAIWRFFHHPCCNRKQIGPTKCIWVNNMEVLPPSKLLMNVYMHGYAMQQQHGVSSTMLYR
eukprot:8890029-Karenia_brevis.AAC.1